MHYTVIKCRFLSAVEGFIFGLVIHMTAQSRSLHYVLQNIRWNQGNNYLSEQQLRYCISESNSIMKMNAILEKTFQLVLFIQYLLGVGLICSLICIIPQVRSSEVDFN